MGAVRRRPPGPPPARAGVRHALRRLPGGDLRLPARLQRLHGAARLLLQRPRGDRRAAVGRAGQLLGRALGPGRAGRVRARRHLHRHQRPADGGDRARPRGGAERRAALPRLPARGLLHPVRDRERRRRRGLDVAVQPQRARELRAGAARARSLVAGQRGAGDADDRRLRGLEAGGVLHPALPRGAAERAARAL